MNETILQKTIAITQEAGETILGFYRGAFDVQEKAPDNPVTDADLAADTLLHERLMTLLPEAGWLSEETVDNPERLQKEYLWVVDPLDGTKEFVMGIPEFSISVALVQNGEPILGVIFNPVTKEMYAALKGHGLTLNGDSITVTGRTEFVGSIIDASRSERKRGEFEPFEEDLEIRTLGSIAYKLARTAAGQADATWSRGPKHEWDICAGVILVLEGGGTCVDLDNQPFVFNKTWPKVNGIIADNGHLHTAVLEALAPHRETARRD
jgi:myo-inositol-1(or 4)-monophosphatase